MTAARASGTAVTARRDAGITPPCADEEEPRRTPNERSWAQGPSVRFEQRGDALVIHLTGALDIDAVPPIRRRLARQTANQRALVVDLRAVTLIDSCGLGLLTSLASDVTGCARPIALVATKERLGDVLRIAGVADAFELAATVDSALALLDERTPLAT